VLGALGTLLWLGLPTGPHRTALTILPAVLAIGLLVATWFAGRASRRHSPAPRQPKFRRALAKPTGAVAASITEARALVTGRDWKLVGALAYYAFDNAVLWAAFHAYGYTPQIGIVVMGYVVGSLAGALPIPAGLGVLEGGLIGALVICGAPAAPATAAVLLYRGISLGVPVRARRPRMHAPPEKPAASPRPARRTRPRSAGARGGTAGRFVVTGRGPPIPTRWRSPSRAGSRLRRPPPRCSAPRL
jgi:hypothetical protein